MLWRADSMSDPGKLWVIILRQRSLLNVLRRPIESAAIGRHFTADPSNGGYLPYSVEKLGSQRTREFDLRTKRLLLL